MRKLIETRAKYETSKIVAHGVFGFAVGAAHSLFFV